MRKVYKILLEHFGEGTLLVSQDIVRREVLYPSEYIINCIAHILNDVTKQG